MPVKSSIQKLNSPNCQTSAKALIKCTFSRNYGVFHPFLAYYTQSRNLHVFRKHPSCGSRNHKKSANLARPATSTLFRPLPDWDQLGVCITLDVCRQRVEESGITSRCTFHEGYLDSLPASDSFDAATCLFVSHFIMQPEERCNFFSQIAQQLHPQGYLINADIASDLSSSAYLGILTIWLGIMKSAGMPDERLEKMRTTYGRDVAVLPSSEVASIIAAGGFDPPVLFFQSLLMHAWYAKRTLQTDMG
jgi:hypothetical protein